ncbi:MAG: flagellar hook-basal body complex protein, partial [Nitrospirota bacterium]|nr:flagellar hook-basal body complex protein [Nitrospirota bacterium]
MGILSSLFAGVSGLNATGNQLSVIGNNIANQGTVGFKSSTATFADLVSSSLGGGSGTVQTGIGVALTSIQTNFSQGSLVTSTNALDMAVDGNGFFTVKDAQGGTFYTRAGQFRLDDQNRVVNPDGLFLQGYQADTNGKITGAIGNIALPSTTASPNKTTKVTTSVNLNASTTTHTFSLSDPTGTSDFSSSLTVFDSLGNSHLLTTYYTRTAANTWTYNVVANSSEVTAGTTSGTYAAANINSTLGVALVASGTLGFTTSGALNTESNATSYDSGTAAGVTGASEGATTISFTGATASQPVKFDFGTSLTTDGGTTGLDGTTQFGAASALVNQTQDGYGAGSLQAFLVDSTGTISGRFSNGQIRTLAQLTLAKFPDPVGLIRSGKNL